MVLLPISLSRLKRQHHYRKSCSGRYVREPEPSEAPHSLVAMVNVPVEMLVYWPHWEAPRGSKALLGAARVGAKLARRRRRYGRACIVF